MLTRVVGFIYLGNNKCHGLLELWRNSWILLEQFGIQMVQTQTLWCKRPRFDVSMAPKSSDGKNDLESPRTTEVFGVASSLPEKEIKIRHENEQRPGKSESDRELSLDATVS